MKEYLPGDLIAENYQVLSRLGEGGMNIVYLVKKLPEGPQYAIKITRPLEELKSDLAEAHNKFLREVAILTTLSHPSLPKVFDYFTKENCYFIVEEYVEGLPLSSHLEKNLPGQGEVICWALKLCDILKTLHRNNIIFRDLKPANIMLVPDGNIKLVDFDIARYFKAGQARDTLLLGTPGYAAPELYGKDQSDRRSDIYSLGATMHQLLTGRDPQESPFHFKPLQEVLPGIDQELSALVHRCLENDREKRFPDVLEIISALHEIQGRLSRKSLPPAPPLPPILPTMAPSSTGDIPRYLTKRAGEAMRGLFAAEKSVNKCSGRPPALSLEPRPSMDEFAGGDCPPWRDFYLYHPLCITKVDLKCTAPQVKYPEALAVTFEFTCTHPMELFYRPYLLEMTLCFAIPLSEACFTDGGPYVQIPGLVKDFHLETPNCWSGTSDRTTVEVVHDGSYIRGWVYWQPEGSLPPLGYSRSLPWRGPRAVLQVKDYRATWQYTTGFIIK
ncbi:MAG: serine/threonine-protein kinase [Candidatus Eremiobacteraeota bacterium]|nr:serine/threonine-protein kinase [Candidatus Eremiobacteraeota bacterium]